MKIHFVAVGSEETREIGKILGQALVHGYFKPKKSLVLALTGDLGSGKTSFVKGLAKGLGVKNKIQSPSFVIFKSFPVRPQKIFSKLIHIDCYRLDSFKDLLHIGLREFISNPQNIVVIEWADKIIRHLPKTLIKINFAYHSKKNHRHITISISK